MDSPNLIIISFISFAAVITILSLLAIIMRILIAVFPEKEDDDNSAIIAAINTVYQKQYPGTRIIKIGEEK